MLKLTARFSWVLISALALVLFLMTARYFSLQDDIFFLREKQDVVHDPLWRGAFFIHITGGMLALVLGPLQFLKQLRNRNRALHRNLGKAYVASILILGAPTGLYMAFYAEGGFWSSAGFTLMSVAWFITTLRAVETAKARDFQAHRNWMVRSYAVTFAAIMLRIWMPLLTLGLGWDDVFVTILTAWLSWVPNLLVAGLLLRRWPQLF